MKRINKTEKIVLVVYFCLLIFNYIVGFEKFQFNSNLGLIMFFTLFAPAFAVHTSPLGISMRKPLFSLIWLTISILILLIPYNHFDNLKLLFHRDCFPFMLPFVGFIYHHIIRQLYMIVLRREPITLWVKGFQKEYINELNRLSDGFDVIFTLVSFFGFFGIFILTMIFSK